MTSPYRTPGSVPPPHELRKALLVDPGWYLRPLPKEMWGIGCSMCRKTQSNWEVGRRPLNPEDDIEVEPVCSLCFLYESWPNEENLEEDLVNLIEQVELQIGEKFDKDPKGRLAVAEDGNRILFSMVMTTRFVQMEGAAVRARQ